MQHCTMQVEIAVVELNDIYVEIYHMVILISMRWNIHFKFVELFVLKGKAAKRRARM